MKICEMTMPEIRYYLAECNFTNDEEALFKLRAKNIPYEECAEIMNISTSTVYRLKKCIQSKLNRM